MIFADGSEADLRALGRVEAHFGTRAPDDFIDQHLADVSILVGQSAMPAERLRRAKHLQAIINVKGNWEPNIDYREAQAQGIYILSIAPILAPAVAEALLGFAIDLARGITVADQAFRSGSEAYGIHGNKTAYSLFEAKVGFVGFGNLGHALLDLLRPFNCSVVAHDPWLSDAYLQSHGIASGSLEEILRESRFIFILAGVTVENENFLDRSKLELIRRDASVILGSRAEVIAFDDFVSLAAEGRFRAAIDVFPEEPMPLDAPVRSARNILLSAHRAGSVPASYVRMRQALIDDIRQILKGHPPMMLQRAEPAQAAMMRSR